MRIAAICMFSSLGLILSGQPAALLAKAAEAFAANQDAARNWTWTARESKSVAGENGTLLQRFPAAQVQSFVRPDGVRCEAVTAWADGLAPNKLYVDPLTRCDSRDEDDFDVADLLRGRAVRLETQTSEAVVLLIPADAALARSKNPRTRCAAAIEARITLEPNTLFPKRIDGRVVTNGCLGAEPARVHFGAVKDASLVYSTIAPGSKFRLEYEFQPDRFGSTGKGYWLLKRSRYENRSSWVRGESCVYWGRSVPYQSRKKGAWLISEIEVLAREFGSSAKISF